MLNGPFRILKNIEYLYPIKMRIFLDYVCLQRTLIVYIRIKFDTLFVLSL